MKIKRQFADPSNTHEVLMVDAKTGEQRVETQPVCSHVTVVHTGKSAEQNFSHRLVEQALLEGWISIADGVLTMKAEPEDLRYRLVREPGYYCVSTGERIPVSAIAWQRFRATQVGDLTRKEALTWLRAKGLPDNDYTVTNAYECVLDAEQHEQLRAVRSFGNAVAANALPEA